MVDLVVLGVVVWCFVEVGVDVFLDDFVVGCYLEEVFVLFFVD